MLSVEIKVNGRIIHKITAINEGKPQVDAMPGMEDFIRGMGQDPESFRQYHIQPGDVRLVHSRDEGAIKLAIGMLDVLLEEEKYNGRDRTQRTPQGGRLETGSGSIRQLTEEDLTNIFGEEVKVKKDSGETIVYFTGEGNEANEGPDSEQELEGPKES